MSTGTKATANYFHDIRAGNSRKTILLEPAWLTFISADLAEATNCVHDKENKPIRSSTPFFVRTRRDALGDRRKKNHGIHRKSKNVDILRLDGSVFLASAQPRSVPFWYRGRRSRIFKLESYSWVSGIYCLQLLVAECRDSTLFFCSWPLWREAFTQSHRANRCV